MLVPGGWWVAVRAIVGEQTDWGAGRAPERRWTADRRTSREYDWTLVSCVVTPGFEYDDFEMADARSFAARLPAGQRSHTRAHVGRPELVASKTLSGRIERIVGAHSASARP